MSILGGLLKTAVGFATGGPAGALMAGASALAGGAAQSKGSSDASKIAAQTSAQQLAFAQQTRDQNVKLQQPYMDLGQAGINPLMRQLGVGGITAPVSSNPLLNPTAPAQGGMDWAAYRANNPDVDAAVRAEGSGFAGSTPDERAADQYRRYGQGEGRAVNPLMTQTPAPVATQAPAATPANPFVVDPNTGGVTAVRPDAGPRPTVDPYVAPTRQAVQPYSFTAEQYKETPGYQYRQSEARKGILASAGATGALQSGAALKELYDRGDQIANQDFTAERGFDYGRYIDANNRSDANFASDRGFGYGVYADETGRSDANFNVDRAYGDSRFDADRGYATNVFNTRTDDLFQLTGIGANAASNVTGANNILSNQQIGATGQAGQAAAQNAQNQGSIWGDTIGQVGGALYQGYQGYKDNKLTKAVTSTINSNPLLF